MSTLGDKRERLQQRLQGLGSVLIAYSGGVDSAFLAWSARQIPGLRMLALIADSPSLARSHLADAVSFANLYDIPLEIIKTAEMENEAYLKNDSLRCFHCKNELFAKMGETKAQMGFQYLAYGMNVDDRGDFRPGQKAALAHEVLAPLLEADLTKADIRALARDANLKVWDKPASACLSSRIAYGNPVTESVLARIEKSEAYLKKLGLTQFRVRDHGGLARVEIADDEIARILTPDFLKTMTTEFKALGFTYVTLDCEGFRSGSMNAVLASANK